MEFKTNPSIPNPQLLNGMNFREPLSKIDLSFLLIIYNHDDIGYCKDINDPEIEIDTFRNLMKHGLIKLDIYHNDELDDNYIAFSVTEAGKQMCDKMMELTKS